MSYCFFSSRLRMRTSLTSSSSSRWTMKLPNDPVPPVTNTALSFSDTFSVPPFGSLGFNDFFPLPRDLARGVTRVEDYPRVLYDCAIIDFGVIGQNEHCVVVLK